MKKYSIDRQNYHIFKIEGSGSRQYVHFQWGKFDFRMIFSAIKSEKAKENTTNTFIKNGKYFLVEVFEVLYHGEWFRFIKPTAHGIQLEETLWTNNGKDYYVEFPKDCLLYTSDAADE